MSIARKTPSKPVEVATVTSAVANDAAGAPAAAAVMKPFNDMQEKLRASTEQGIEQLRTHYATLKGNAESATDKLEESIAAAHSGTRAFNLKVVELFRAQTNAGFAHLQALFAVKTLGDAVKLNQDFAKAQIAAIQTNTKEFAELAKQIAEDVAEPVKASIVLPFKR